MPIVLKNRGALPTEPTETVEVLGLSIPVTDSLPFGGQVELMDLQNAFEAGEVGKVEFLMRVFCLFTWRLPKHEHVRYEWLSRQTLEVDEVKELMDGTLHLLNGFKREVVEGNAPKPKKGRKAVS